MELRCHGANLVGRCPFHDDQGPSLVVTPSKNLWHSLGACQAGGSVIDWVVRDAERLHSRSHIARSRRDPVMAYALNAVASPSLSYDRSQLHPACLPLRKIGSSSR